jgi:hypothetical protein
MIGRASLYLLHAVLAVGIVLSCVSSVRAGGAVSQSRKPLAVESRSAVVTLLG